MGAQIGVNINDPVLRRKEKQDPRPASLKNVNEMLDFCVLQNWKLIRIPYYWEAAIGNHDNFFNELEFLLEGCKARGMQAIPDFHHYYCTSAWGPGGAGFPSSFVKNYHVTQPFEYEKDPAVRAFWNDLYNDTVSGVNDAWLEIADFQGQVAAIERKYSSAVYGHELLNEPHLFQDANYMKLGSMFTWIGRKVRQILGDPLIFTRGTGRQGYKRNPSLEHLIRPKLKRTIYSPHLYRADAIAAQVSQWNALIANWKIDDPAIKVFVGEFADQETEGKPTLENIDAFVKTWHSQNYDSTYWAAFLNTPDLANRLTDPGPELTQTGIWYSAAIVKYYGH